MSKEKNDRLNKNLMFGDEDGLTGPERVKKTFQEIISQIKQNDNQACKTFINHYWDDLISISNWFKKEPVGNVISAAFAVIRDYNDWGDKDMYVLRDRIRDQVFKEIYGFSRRAKLELVPIEDYLRFVIADDPAEQIEKKDLVRFILAALSDEEYLMLEDIISFTNKELQGKWGISQTGVSKRKDRFLQELRKRLKNFVIF